MAASRLSAFFLLRILVQAGAAAPWNSTDMISKHDADEATQAKRASEWRALQAASRQMDAWLSGNKTVLTISKEALSRAESKHAPLAKRIEDANASLRQAQEDLMEKNHDLLHSIHSADAAAHTLAGARAALADARNKVIKANASANSAFEEEAMAEDNLQQMTICCPGKVLDAQRRRDLYRQDLADAGDALHVAKSEEAAKQVALESAAAAAQSAEKERCRARAAYQDAVGAVERWGIIFDDLNKKGVDPETQIAAMNKSVKMQEIVVKDLGKSSQELRDRVLVAKKTYDEISAVVGKDLECIPLLQTREEKLEMTTDQVNLTAEAYNAAPATVQQFLKATLWQQVDREQCAARDLYDVQKDCAPKSVKLPKAPDLPNCSADTGGSCHFLNCWGWRQAVCSESRHCICLAGTCSVSPGVCKDRGLPPVFLVSPPTEPQLRAEPAAASTALLVAIALVTTAILVMRRRRTSVNLSREALG